MSNGIHVNLEMTAPQAAAVSAACWMYVRLGTGHLEEILEYMRHGLIPARRDVNQERAPVDTADFMAIRRQLLGIKELLGFRADMMSGHKVDHPHIHPSVLEAFQVRQELYGKLNDPRVDGVTLDMTVRRAGIVSEACDLYTRLGMGQMEEIVDLVRWEVIPSTRAGTEGRVSVSGDTVEKIERHVTAIKHFLGHHPNSSLGVGHPHVDLSAKRAWETKKAIDQALALHRDPDPEFRGANYDGNYLRYTDDPVPVVTVHGVTTNPTP